jgi:fused signal recognition particle receptor
MNMFTFFKEVFTKVYTQFSSKIQELLGKSTIDQATIQELSRILIAADTGVQATRTIIGALEKAQHQRELSGQDAKKILEQQLLSMLPVQPKVEPSILLLVGINGSGKTTCAGKLAYQYVHQKKRVLLVAADTFRAAATEQLATWADRAGATLFAGKQGQDPSSVVFAACRKFVDEKFDLLIIDTAGRLQTKTNLMQELEKIKRTIGKQLPDKTITTLLVLDAMLGQNSLQQARIFHEVTNVDGIILTKLDGTGKGGIIFAIAQELKLPVLFVTSGEKIEQLQPFDARDYVEQLLR